MTYDFRTARLTTAITAVPMNFQQYIDIFQYKLSRGATQFKRELKTLSSLDFDPELLRNGYAIDITWSDLEELLAEFQSLHEWLGQTSGFSTFSKLKPHFERLRDEVPRLLQFETPYKQSIQERFESYDAPPKALAAYLDCLAITADVSTRLKSLQIKFDAYLTLKQPSTKNTEKLYHASIKARELAKGGFQHQRPEGIAMGLGGNVSDKAGNNAISFTFNEHYAHQISRYFKEMAQVARGEIKASQILRWAAREGVAEQVLKGFGSVHGLTVGNGAYGTSLDQTKIEFENGKYRVVHRYYDPSTRAEAEEPGDPDLIFHSDERVFRLYASLVNSSPYRRDPFGRVATMLEQMKRENVQDRDIGVIVAEVDDDGS